jgi:hypothetical protein
MIPMNFIDQFKERFAFRIRDLGEGVPHDPLQPDAGLAIGNVDIARRDATIVGFAGCCHRG